MNLGQGRGHVGLGVFEADVLAAEHVVRVDVEELHLFEETEVDLALAPCDVQHVHAHAAAWNAQRERHEVVFDWKRVQCALGKERHGRVRGHHAVSTVRILAVMRRDVNRAHGVGERDVASGLGMVLLGVVEAHERGRISCDKDHARCARGLLDASEHHFDAARDSGHLQEAVQKVDVLGGVLVVDGHVHLQQRLHA